MLKSIQKILASVIITTILMSSIPIQSYAFLGVGDATIIIGDTSLTSISRTIDSQLLKLKNFVLDRLAVLVAKQILHQITMSVINWINNGFEGSPAFLDHPEAFFLDVADQITGAYLATNGPLSTLCSPFNIDLRLSLALNAANNGLNAPFTCTLGKIIETQKNGPNVTINGQVVHSAGNSMNGFLGGDFKQGGWPAFIALTTEPQNNYMGSMLSAQGNLSASLLEKQNNIKADLQMGAGFMSWQKCNDFATNIDPNDTGSIEATEIALENDTGVRTTKNKDGTINYQTCETQTPGSVIAGTLQTSLNVPIVELELANDINAIIDALISKLVSTMIETGLKGLSGSGSGSGQGGTSYTEEVIRSAKSYQLPQADLSNLGQQISSAIDGVNGYKRFYDEAVKIIRNSKNKYLNVKTTCQNNSHSSEVTELDSILQNKIDPLLNNLELKLKKSNEQLKKLEDISYSLAGTGSLEQVQTQITAYTNYMQSEGANVQLRTDNAKEDLDNAKEQAEGFDADAAQIYYICGASINI